MNNEKIINLDIMKRIGVITVATNRLYRDDYFVMTKDGLSPTETFFERMKDCMYKNGQDCILSMNSDDNLILAHLDNNAIFLLSEDVVLSPNNFVNAMINLQDCSNEMRRLITRSSNTRFSGFELASLNINFANIELATGMQAEITEEYMASIDSSDGISQIESKYDKKVGTISHKYASQYGTNIIGFLNEIVRVNPDIRLLMSNVICQESSLNLVQTMMDSLGNIDSPEERRQWKHPDPKKVGEFFSTFESKRNSEYNSRIKNNEGYEVYSALKYAVEFSGETSDFNQKYLLKWYEGNPDLGYRAINYALNNMLMAAKSEDDSNMCAPRTLPEVKSYMNALDSRALNISISNQKRISEVNQRKKGVSK